MSGVPSSVAGVGINDAGYKIAGCPFYARWLNMMQRCYGKGMQRLNPAYAGCSVCNEWLRFSAFKAWMEKQDWVGMHLDKDILVIGNKVYGPTTCVFVTAKTNSLVEKSSCPSPSLPRGVSVAKRQFMATGRNGSKPLYLGLFPTAKEAHAAWQWSKAGILWAAAKEQTNPKVASALELRASMLIDDVLNERESGWY